MFESDILIAGADSGFGAIKLDTGDSKVLFPAVIRKGNERIFSTLGNTLINKGSELETQIASFDVIVKNNSTST